jgi:hypothetical protein
VKSESILQGLILRGYSAGNDLIASGYPAGRRAGLVNPVRSSFKQAANRLSIHNLHNSLDFPLHL